ncbi:hypothetical protein [Rubrobacter marinus]|uniref:hypothetical protein n=1 Tax=Rubrobacter marinus TaxID=2653852 RepID=UPI0014088AED|nr:hypothetical protein [Rubrobacter marinus]
MGAELWQFGGMAAVGVGVVAMWILFVYRPRKTGEGTPPVDPSVEEEGPEQD